MSARTTSWCLSRPNPKDGHEPLEPGENEVLVEHVSGHGVYIGSGQEYRRIGDLRICRLCACVYMEEMEP